MPKVVDHDERRREIGAAVCRIAAAEGLEAVSVRRVAAEAGLSAPLVQRYFPEKSAMLLFAITDLTARGQRITQERIRDEVERGPGPTPHAIVRAVLVQCLPLDEERRLVLLVHQAYFSRAVYDQEVASIYRDESPLLAAYLGEEIARGQREGQVDQGVDPVREADTLLCVAIELGAEILLGSRAADAAIDLIDYHLERIFR